MNADARAEAERRYKDGMFPAINRNDQNAFVAGAQWQASRPFTEEDVLAAATELMRDDPEAEKGTYSVDDYLAMARAALDAVQARNTARHTKGDGA